MTPEAFSEAARRDLQWPEDMRVNRETAVQALAVRSLLISMLGLDDAAEVAGLALLIAMGDERAEDKTRTLLGENADRFVAQLREITARRAK